MQILKDAAEACGRDTARYGTHSLRRGGGSAYLLAGKTLEAVAFYGRWADVGTCRLYVEPSASHLMRGAQDKVNSGMEEPHYILRQPARPRERVESFRSSELRQSWSRSSLKCKITKKILYSRLGMCED